MFVRYFCVLFACCVLTSHCYKLNKTLCEGSLCVYLYQSDSHSLSWDNSYTTCRSENLEMLRIETSQTQTIVERLLQDLPSGSQGQVWIGGRRSTDDGWRYMNGTEFNKQVTTPNNEPRPYCLFVKLCKTRKPEYNADNCDEKYGNSALLCERDPNNTGKCSSGYSLLGNKCYLKTKYQNKIDWYTGETYCSQGDIHGDIAYSYLDNNTLTNSIINLVKGNAACVQLWLGVRKRIWFWKTDQSRDVHKPAIRYFHWFDGTTATSAGDCIYIDKDNGYKWLTQSCSTNLNYCICMNKTANTVTASTTSTTTTVTTSTTTAVSTSTTTTVTTSTTTTVTRSSNPTVTTTTSETVAPGNNSASSARPAAEFKKIYSVPIVIGIIVAVVIGVAVYFVLKKRREKAEDVQYDDIELEGGNGELIDPYCISGSDNVTSTEVRHKEAPSGDLYAVSGKQVNKPDVNKNVPSTKPKKKGNKKRKPSPSETMDSSNNDYTEVPSGGETSTGSKRTEHLVAPSGDVYATVRMN